MPDPTIPSNETGTRHRTAERVAKQTDALVVSISQQRETVTIFVGQQRYQLDPIADVLAKTNQGVATLETYRQRLDQVMTRLTALEFQGAVVLDDVLVVVQRAEMTTRVARGDRARLRRARHRGAADPDAALRADRRGAGREGGGRRDYCVERRRATRSTRSSQLPYARARSTWRCCRRCSATRARSTRSTTSVARSATGSLSHIPRLPEAVIAQVVADIDGLECDRPGDPARARGGGGRRRGAGARDPGGPAPAAGAQPRRPLPAAVTSPRRAAEQGFSKTPENSAFSSRFRLYWLGFLAGGFPPSAFLGISGE